MGAAVMNPCYNDYTALDPPDPWFRINKPDIMSTIKE